MSTLPLTPTGQHFTPFRSAAEEASSRTGEDTWENEGGHMSSSAGRIVRTPGRDLPYTVILSRHGRPESERAFATMREAEAFVRCRTPRSAGLSNLYDRPAEERPHSTSVGESRS